MSIYVQAWVYAHSEATLADRLVLLAIADEADDDGRNAYPSQDRIAHKARLSRSTVQRSIVALEQAGELVVIRPLKRGRGRVNRYVLPMGRSAEDLGKTAAEVAQDDTDMPAKPPRNDSRVTHDPRPLTTYGKRQQDESFPTAARTALGRGLDAEPIWDELPDGTLRRRHAS